METPMCKSSVVSGDKNPPHLQQRIGSRCLVLSFIYRRYTQRWRNRLPVKSRGGILQRGKTLAAMSHSLPFCFVIPAAPAYGPRPRETAADTQPPPATVSTPTRPRFPSRLFRTADGSAGLVGLLCRHRT